MQVHLKLSDPQRKILTEAHATPRTDMPEDTTCLCQVNCKENCILDTNEINKANTESENIQHKDKNIRLAKDNSILKLQVTSLSNNLAFERDNLKDITKKKESVESNYQDAARSIPEIQEQATIREEQIKVLGDIFSSDEETKEEEAATEENGWIEIYEDVTENGDLMPHMEKSTATLACKKCDKVLKSDHELREHIKKHSQLNKQLLKCDYCSYETNYENDHTNHVVDHSPKHICDTCISEFSTKNKLVEHIVKDNLTTQMRPDQYLPWSALTVVRNSAQNRNLSITRRKRTTRQDFALFTMEMVVVATFPTMSALTFTKKT